MNRTLDAIVIGGGPAGSTAALLLARSGWSVAVVEKSDFPRRKVCGEFLSATTVPLLRHLGVDNVFAELAGPDIRRVGVFAGDCSITAPMPRFQGDGQEWGRALGREHLDTVLLDRAAAEGAAVWQPWRVVELQRQDRDPGDDGTSYLCKIVSVKTREFMELRARYVIAAHGSWEPGQLPTQPERRRARRSDLFGFKAHFRDSKLPADLMPLIAFPGGYGGLVHSDHGRVSLSCCIRRDHLERCRRTGGTSAGDAVLAHMRSTCEPLRDVLGGAVLDDGWRSAGPIRPGIRSTNCNGAFLAGNAAGEAHPVVAEGISMAMQSGWLLARHLVAGTENEYTTAWRRMFARRIHAAAVLAHWAMRPAAVTMILPLLRTFPVVLTQGARTAGKVSATFS